jgi:hypothetical protein
LRKRRFPNPRNVFNEQMPARQQSDQRQLYDFRLPVNDAFDSGLKLLDLACRRYH